jgi:hypothetical protein
MKYVLPFLVGAGAVLVLLLVILLRLGPTPSPIHVQSQGPTVERLERLSQLVTLRVSVADVLVGEGEGCRGAWLIKGDALLGIDLARAQIVERDEAARSATLLLPSPAVMHPRVDHTRSKTWEVRRMAWLPWNANEDRLRDAVMQQAQELVGQAAGSEENLQQARSAAEAILTSFYAEVGWRVKVTWAKEAGGGPKGHR